MSDLHVARVSNTARVPALEQELLQVAEEPVYDSELLNEGLGVVSELSKRGDVAMADRLLAAVATQAFDGLTAALEAGNARGGASPVARLREQGVGYVDFALRHPGRFSLMFRSGLPKTEALVKSAQVAFATRSAPCGISMACHLPGRWTPRSGAR